MRLVAFALIVLPVALAAPTEAGPRAGKGGKIVRVERPRTGARGTPRVCQLIDNHTGRCYGKAPIAGEIATLVSAQKTHGQIRVGKVEPSDPQCQTPQFYSFAVEEVDAKLDTVEPWSTHILIDVDVTPNARFVEASRVKPLPDGSSPWLAFDRTGTAGDDGADFVVTTFTCDEQGQPYQGGYGGNGGYCVDYYTLAGSRWDLVRRDVVVACRY